MLIHRKFVDRILSIVLLSLILLALAACLNSGPAPTENAGLRLATEEVLPAADEPPKPVDNTRQPTNTAVKTTPVPAVSQAIDKPTLTPISVSITKGVPSELGDVVHEMIADRLDGYILIEDDADLTLGVSQSNPLATWIYAVAVPFYSLKEESRLEDLKLAWSAGDLILDQQTEKLLIELWGNPDMPATIVPPDELVSELWARQSSAEEPPITILPFERLSPRLKVLRLNGQSPVTVDFDRAGYPLSIQLGLEGSAADAEALLSAWHGPQTNRNEQLLTRIAMTGPAGMRRAVADRMEKYGLNYPAEETGPVLQSADIAHMSNENAFATDCPMPDPFDSVNVCNRDEYVQLMVWMGIDVNEMTGNHLNDWGSASLLHTFDLYESLGIQTFGGGRDLEQAQEPLLMEHHGNRIAFVGCNPVGPPSAWAKTDYPGSLACEDYQFLKEQIRELSGAGYLVIATVQYREDYTYDAADDQRDVFKSLAAEGAMAVSGSHGHHPQGFAFLNDSFIHYGLGNLLADQMWSLASRQAFIDTYLVYDGRLLNVDLWTGLNEDYARVRQMTIEERHALLDAVYSVSEP